jgi:hypothetical protein
MAAGNGALSATREVENRISAPRLENAPMTPQRMAKIPATMMEVEARGGEVMHSFYIRF